MKLSLRERAYSSMNYADYQRTQIQSATPLFRPLEAPAVPPPIELEPHTCEEKGEETELVTRLLREHILKQDVSCRQREMKALQAELQAVRQECEVLLGKASVRPAETLLQGALRSRSSSSA